MNHHDLDLARLAEAQHGIFDPSDARAVGLTERQCDYRIRAGLWLPIYDGVFRLPGSIPSIKGRLAAVCRVIRPDAAVSHRSAAVLWALPGARDDIVEISSPHRKRARHTGVVGHESRQLHDCDRTVVDGIRVTTVARTLVDLGAVCSDAVVEMALDRALRRKLTTFAEVQARLDAIGKRGRPGVGVLRKILDARDPRHAPSESEMETMLRRVLRRHGLPAPVPQYVIRDGDHFVARVDFAYPDHRIVIEYDSLEHHVGTGAHVRDSARRLQIEALDWSVVVATVGDVRNGGDLLVRAIRAVRARRARRIRSDAEFPRLSA
jgi:very-short-patch-repair endonuclease